ncbi:uncharacterized protein LOC134694215 [Mytilus trossulus]|uniref:uncharacterized protein LOC134694215 n=1 Tax=Mytilus trossulus TaxID=6551 RepID=UPI0030044CFA
MAIITGLGYLDKSEYLISTSATSISISWEEHRVPRGNTAYVIKYRKISEDCFTSKTTNTPFAEIDELHNDTEYRVNVYWENADGDNVKLLEEVCTTEKSDMDYLKSQNTSIDKTRTGQPVLYQFHPVHKREENGNDKDKAPKSKEDSTNYEVLQICDMIAEYDPGIYTSNEKTVLLLGATGTGKSTLIDGLINYIAGVSYNDDYRFSLIHKTKEERIQSETPGQSQTSTTTIYRIPELDGSKVSFKVNIIDTIGFIDTRKHFDKKLTDQLQTLFGGIIEHLDAVLVVIPLSTQRLTEGQEYVFSSISKLFGKEIEENICVAITHDDGGEPTCLGLLEKALKKFPQGNVFRFNNSFVLKKAKQNRPNK